MPTKTTQPSDNLTNPYGYSERDWAVQLDPAYAAARAEVRRLSVGEDGTLSVNVKELMRHEGGVVRGHQSRGPPWRRHRLQGGGPDRSRPCAAGWAPPPHRRHPPHVGRAPPRHAKGSLSMPPESSKSLDTTQRPVYAVLGPRLVEGPARDAALSPAEEIAMTKAEPVD